MNLKQLRLKRKIIFFTRIFVIFLFIISLMLQIKNIIISSSINIVTQSEITELKEPVSILFLGADYGGLREIDTSSPPRADTIITLTLNPNNENGNVEINLTSIPRDVRMPITCNENYEDKVNSAFSYGYLENGSIDDAISCQEETVEQFFGIDIDYHVLINFDTFINFIDRIDGIEIDVPYAFYEMDSNDTPDALYFEEGLQTLDGEHALAYARQRHAINPETGYSGDDFERNIRQQEVLTAAIAKILSNPTSYLDDAISIVFYDMETNLDISILTHFANFGVSQLNTISNNLSNHTTFNIYFKDPYNAKNVYINPYEDLLGKYYNEDVEEAFSNWYEGELNDQTMTTPLVLDYRYLNFPSTTKVEQTQTVSNYEIMLSTIDTYPALDGSGDELTTYETRLYYSEVLAKSLDQTPNIDNYMSYYSEY